MLSSFRPTDPHSNFQEIWAWDDPSFRAKYTYKVGGEKRNCQKKLNSVENTYSQSLIFTGYYVQMVIKKPNFSHWKHFYY